MAYGKLYGGPTTQHEGYAVTGKAPQDDETFGLDGHDHKHKPRRLAASVSCGTTNVASAPALRFTLTECLCRQHRTMGITNE